MIKTDVPLNLIEVAYPNGGRDIDGLLSWTLELFISSSWKSEQHKVYVNIDMWLRKNICSDISKTHDTIKSMVSIYPGRMKIWYGMSEKHPQSLWYVSQYSGFDKLVTLKKHKKRG